MVDKNAIPIYPLIIILSIVSFVIIMQIPVDKTHAEGIRSESTVIKNAAGALRFGANTHGESAPVEDTHGKILTSNIKPDNGENAISIEVFIMTTTGQKTHHNFQKVIQWTQQEYPDRLTPQLQLDSIPSTDKEYLYNMAKQKFENHSDIDDVDIFLEAISKDNVKIISTKYIGCEIDQYWLSSDIDEQHPSLESSNVEPHEQFFFKCKNYFVITK